MNLANWGNERDVSVESFGRRIQGEFRNLLVQAADVFHTDTALWECEGRIRALIDKIVTPFNIAVFGRVKAGKSSIVNALLGKRLAVVFSEEATATVNVISHAESNSDRLNQFAVHWTDQQPELFPIEKLREEWTGKDDVLLQDKVRRTNYLELYSDAGCLKLHEIIDTPGIGSAVAEHERVTQAFLEGAMAQGKTPDAMIYVIESVATLRDLESVEKFRDTCMPGSDPYNTVGVLHKWDSEYFQHGMKGVAEKCQRLRSRFDGVLADVIPISAPIAFVATSASDEELREIFALTDRISVAKLTSCLMDPDSWDDDEERKGLRLQFKEKYDCPWASFRILVREMCEHPRRKVDAYRKHLYEKISGFGRLREFLDRKFFRMGALIRQRQTYVQVNRIFAEAKDILWRKSVEMSHELQFWRQLHCAPNGNAELQRWIDRNSLEMENKIRDAANLLSAIEREFEGREIVRIIEDVTLREWCSESEFAFIVDALKNLIAPVLDTLSGSAEDARVSMTSLQKFYGELCALADSGIDPDCRRQVEKLKLRILAFVAAKKDMEKKHDCE